MAVDNSTSDPHSPRPQLSTVDTAVIAVHFALNVAVGIWSSCRASRNTVNGYFLAGRDMTWWPIGASLFASSEGSGLFIGLAGAGAAGGLAVAGFEWNATYVLLALAWVFVPIYLSSEIVTMPEYMQKRYGGQRIRVYLSVLSLLLSVFTKISIDLYAGALFVHICLGWNFYLSTIIMLAITALYTIAGGLTAVIYTDALQTLVMVVGAVILTIKAFEQIGGYEQLAEAYARAVPSRTISNTTCHVPRADAMHMFRDPYTGDLPWTGMTFGLTIMAAWYWCTDQMGRLSPGENLGPRCSDNQQGCCRGSGTAHSGLTGHRAAVTVRPGPEPRQGGLHPGQLSQDVAHGPDRHAGHDQPRAVPRANPLPGSQGGSGNGHITPCWASMVSSGAGQRGPKRPRKGSQDPEGVEDLPGVRGRPGPAQPPVKVRFLLPFSGRHSPSSLQVCGCAGIWGAGATPVRRASCLEGGAGMKAQWWGDPTVGRAGLAETWGLRGHLRAP